jgi:hypothetical protein
MHLKPNKNGIVGVSESSGFVTTNQNRILSITRIVITITVLLALLMIISK